MFTHTNTHACRDNKRFVFTSNINEKSSSSSSTASASASSNQLGDVLGHTCVEDDHDDDIDDVYDAEDDEGRLCCQGR